MLHIFKVKGDSMAPTLAGNDYVITSRFLSLKENRLVVVNHPVYQQLIKRIKSIKKDGTFLLVGDNKESLTTEKMGSFSKKSLCGVVWFCIRAKR